jgi:hypothetical protein
MTTFATTLCFGQSNTRSLERLNRFTVAATNRAMSASVKVRTLSSIPIAVLADDDPIPEPIPDPIPEPEPEPEPVPIPPLTQSGWPNICANLTLPPACGTQSGNCFTEGTNACTKSGSPCDRTVPPFPNCARLTTVDKCTSGFFDCGMLTLYSKCNTSSNCLTSQTEMCGTSGWYCAKMTIKPGCSNGDETFSPPPASCLNTYNWDCANTKNDLCNTSGSGCTLTRGIPCTKTYSPRCLTYAGKACPAPVNPPAPEASATVVALALVAVGACFAGSGKAGKS